MYVSINHQSRFRCHQLGSPLLESMLMKNFRDSSQTSRMMEKHRPGMPSKKKGRCRPPKMLLTPGMYRKKMKRKVSRAIPPNMCGLTAEKVKET
jgi:hypothetical protein